MRTCNIHQFLMLILCLIVIYGILGFYYIAQSDLNDNKIKMEQTERIIYDRKRVSNNVTQKIYIVIY